MKKMVTNWSYSALKTYKQCPRKLKLGRLDGIKEPMSPPLERGVAIHKLAEDFVAEKQLAIPCELAKFKEEFLHLQAVGARAEEEWAFLRSWEPCGWHDPSVWIRMKVDAFHFDGPRMTIIDYKTGKVYGENKGQCSFYALGAFIMFPEITSIDVHLWYLDSGDTVSDNYEREEMDDMKAWWEHEARPMLCDTTFAPRPSYMCKWCFFSNRKNGNCEY